MIKIQNFSFSYIDAKEKALSKINLEVQDGEFLGIIGSSGAGKTTLSYAINGIIPHHYKGDYYGKVLINDKDVFDTDPCQLALEIGSVFQDIDSQMTSATVEDEILFGMENFGFEKQEIYERLDWVLKEMQIEFLRERDISSLSGGQKQKVAIAAILALRPKILVLDEPTGELDPAASRNIFRIIKELNEKYGLTVIVIEQKIRLLCEYAKKLAVLKHGELTFHGTVEEVLSHRDELADLGLNHERVGKILDQIVAASKKKNNGDVSKDSTVKKFDYTKYVSDAEPMVTIEKMSFGYDVNYLINDVDFNVYKGDFLALTGENGSGKSTLSKLIGGILKPASGSVKICGLESKKTKNSILARHIGFLFQNPDRQLCCYTILEEIAFGLKALKLPDAEKHAKEIVDRFGFDPTMAPFALSRGQRQQLALASIIAVHPEVMILDEPTTGLDYKECMELMNAVKELNEKGTTVIMVCHDMELVRDFAKRMVVVAKGSIVADGYPKDLVPIMEENSLGLKQFDGD